MDIVTDRSNGGRSGSRNSTEGWTCSGPRSEWAANGHVQPVEETLRGGTWTNVHVTLHVPRAENRQAQSPVWEVFQTGLGVTVTPLPRAEYGPLLQMLSTDSKASWMPTLQSSQSLQQKQHCLSSCCVPSNMLNILHTLSQFI